MGINGSDVARDAAAVILMDDNFASIVLGVKEGRTIFDNLTKTIAYTVTHMTPEVVPILMNLAFGFPLALGALLILTIDLFTEMAPAISMAYEPSESNVMLRPPRNSKTDRLVTWQVFCYAAFQAGAIECLAGFTAFFAVFRYYGVSGNDLFNTPFFSQGGDEDMPGVGTDPNCENTFNHNGPYHVGNVCYTAKEQERILNEAQTAYWAMLTTAQVFHVWLCKTRIESVFTHGLLRNEFTLWGVAVEICIIILIIFPPSSNSIFFSRPFPERFWALLVVAPTALFLWQEGRKWWVRRHPHGFFAKINW
jgi:sodium/potassium-transporting ATPase subunit alpha